MQGEGKKSYLQFTRSSAIGDEEPVNAPRRCSLFHVNQFCQQCHAEIAEEANPVACPACGGKLIPQSGLNLDAPGAPPRQADRRGILLPRRHAVGGVITPR